MFGRRRKLKKLQKDQRWYDDQRKEVHRKTLYLEQRLINVKRAYGKKSREYILIQNELDGLAKAWKLLERFKRRVQEDMAVL